MKKFLIVFTMIILAMSLSACGKKGELKPPPSHEKTN